MLKDNKVKVIKYRFRLPTKVLLPRVRIKDKPFRLNFNVYNNTHNFVLDQAKQSFYKSLDKRQLPKFKADKIRISYTVVFRDKRSKDLNNMWVVVDKFFCDWLVTRDYLQDDNVGCVEYGTIKFGGINKKLKQHLVYATVEVLK